MNDDQRQERDDWEALLGSAGWRRLVALAEQQWTGAEAFRRDIERAVAQGDGVLDTANASRNVQIVMAKQKGSERVLSYPGQRLLLLKGDPAKDEFARYRRVP